MNDRVSQLPDPAASPLPAGQPAQSLPAGMRLGTFEIKRVLARSPNAVVYLATDHALGMEVAIQEYLPAQRMRRDAGLRLIAAAAWHEEPIARGLRAFVDDARMLARCEHPALVRVHQLFHANGSAYRVMPVCAGQRLSELRREMPGPPDEASLGALLDGLLGAIEAIHLSGRVHGGVNAENILLLADDRPLLLGAGAAARELGVDLVASLMATLDSSNGATPTADAGTPPTGVALDLFMLADVMRWCITARPPASPDVTRTREPLANLIAHTFAAEARPEYSAALLGALDAAVSPFAQDRPLNVAQFRDWLARGVPEVPGGAPRSAPAVRSPMLTGAAPALAPKSPHTPVPTPEPEPPAGAERAETVAAAPGAVAAPSPLSSSPPLPPHPAYVAPPPAPTVEPPIAPWPEVVRAIDLPLAGHSGGGAAPLKPAPKHMTTPRQRRYQWLLGSALALLAAGVLAIATGVWNRAPEISFGPDAQRIATPAPRAGVEPAPRAGVEPAPRAGVEPAQRAGVEPAPRAGAEPTPRVAQVPPSEREAPEPAPAIPRPEAADTAVANNGVGADVAPTVDPSRALAIDPPAAGPVPRARAVRAAHTAPTASVATGLGPRAACAGRTEFALYRCLLQQCQAKRWTLHPQCVKLRLNDRVD